MPKPLRLRVVFHFKGTTRKSLTLILGGDNSFYIHPYRPPGQPWRIPGDESEDEPGRIRLDLANPISPMFDLQKISFHRSGYIQLTNGKPGEDGRFKNGTRGPAFGEMKSPYDLCMMVPCDPDLLPVHKDKGDHVYQIVLPDAIGPFSVMLTVIDALTPLANQGTDIVPPLSFLFEGHSYGLAFTVKAVRNVDPGETPEWPTFPYFLLRIAA